MWICMRVCVCACACVCASVRAIRACMSACGRYRMHVRGICACRARVRDVSRAQRAARCADVLPVWRHDDKANTCDGGIPAPPELPTPTTPGPGHIDADNAALSINQPLPAPRGQDDIRGRKGERNGGGSDPCPPPPPPPPRVNKRYTRTVVCCCLSLAVVDKHLLDWRATDIIGKSESVTNLPSCGLYHRWSPSTSILSCDTDTRQCSVSSLYWFELPRQTDHRCVSFSHIRLCA